MLSGLHEIKNGKALEHSRWEMSAPFSGEILLPTIAFQRKKSWENMQKGWKKNTEKLKGSEEKKRVLWGKSPRYWLNLVEQHCGLSLASRSMRWWEPLPSQCGYSSVMYFVFQNDCQRGLIFSIPPLWLTTHVIPHDHINMFLII